ncbi:MAG TPA: LytTR family DNA-binding domain-containing protein [Bryobacteraceae bacterium]|nr:LytTR family DNA-binding domain-containing protein [Bryobacteraceae bacterium]
MPLSPSEGLRVLVADDEAPARQRIIDLLRNNAQVTSIIEASDGIAAVEIIGNRKPDLVFLDVQMPERNGLEVIAEVGAEHMPLTVFVTAYDEHAIRAFEANALDYLLKPFSDERFETTMARVGLRIDERSLHEFGRRILHLVSGASGGDPPLDRLVVKSGGSTRFVRAADIDWIEAAGVYANLHVGGKELLYRAALNDLAARLDPVRFVRIHRSAIVNIESILHLDPISHGEFEVVLKDGSRLKISRTYRSQLEKRLGQSL